MMTLKLKNSGFVSNFELMINSANLGQGILCCMRPGQSKVMRTYAQSGQYHTILESHVYLTNRTSIVISYNSISRLVGLQSFNPTKLKKKK